MEQLNELRNWETEMDKLERMNKDIFRMRQELRDHEFYSGLRCLIIVCAVCAAWYFRAI